MPNTSGLTIELITHCEMVKETPGLSPSEVHRVESELSKLGYGLRWEGEVLTDLTLESCSWACGSSWECWGLELGWG